MKSFRILVASVAGLLVAGPLYAQISPQKITVPLSRPGDPITLEVSILSARIEVIGEDRQDADFELTIADGKRKIITPSGPKPLTGGGYAIEIEEDDNVISVDTDWRANKVNLTARIPRNADLVLSTTNEGEIIVRNIDGALQLSNVTGPITARNIRGSVIAESVNDFVDVSFDALSGEEAMSMTTINGDIKLAIPANAGAQLHLDTSSGEIYSDFEVDVQPSEPVITRDEDDDGVEVRIESVIVANVNGGGPVIRLRTLHGNIEISKSGN